MDGETLSQATPPVLYQALDPRVVKLWKIRSLIASGVLLSLAGVGVLILGFGRVAPWPGLVVAWLTLGGLRAYFFFWHQQRVYRNWGYRLDGKVLETRHGIWWRQLQLLPLPRLQHVDLHSGPIERSLGLASLLLHTAGTHEATIVIPGLDANEAVRLRDHLVMVGGDDGV
ncbi:MAG TPA: PH domain-containing protein [Verrucomicrobiae bacterium]|nr:PH domain-containing protein [Verrucomicrobiae bacterium]